MGAAVGIALAGVAVTSHAEDAKPSHVAEPGVYKVLAENELFRVVLATWPPGNLDNAMPIIRTRPMLPIG